MIASLQSLSLHPRWLTLFTSSPWQVKNSWLPLVAHRGAAALPLCHPLQLCVQALTQRWCWRRALSWRYGTASVRSQAGFFYFCSLETLQELGVVQIPTGAHGGQERSLPRWRALMGRLKNWGTFSIEILLLIYKAEMELVSLIRQLGAWFYSSLVKGKEAAELDYPKGGVGTINWTILNLVLRDSFNCDAF